jgi:hypothetical protein
MMSQQGELFDVYRTGGHVARSRDTRREIETGCGALSAAPEVAEIGIAEFTSNRRRTRRRRIRLRGRMRPGRLRVRRA